MKKTNPILLLIAILCNSGIVAQPATYFNSIFGYYQTGEGLTNVIPLNNKYYALGFSATPTTKWKLSFNIIDSVGDTTTSKVYTNPNYTYYNLGAANNFMYDTHDSSFVFAGGLIGDGIDISGVLIKFNKYGDTLWSKTYDKDSVLLFNGLIIENDGYLLYGYSQEQDTWGDTYMAKTDFNGAIIWEKIIHIAGKNGGAHVMNQTFDKGYILAMNFQWQTGTNYGYVDNLFQKTDSLGNVQWTKIYGTPYDDYQPYIIQTKDSNYVFSTGYIERETGGAHGNTFARSCLTKINQNGNMIWQKKYCDTTFDNNNNIVKELSDGSLITLGYYESAYPVFWPYVGYVLKTTYNGDSLWYHTYMYDSLSHNSIIYDIEPTNDNGFVMVGSADDTIHQQYWILKTDSVGCYNTNCSFENVTSVEHLLKIDETELSIYPNPATISLTLALSTGEGMQSVKIYNVLGELVLDYARTDKKEITLDVSKLQRGLYVVVAQTEKGLIRKKVIKN